MSETAHRTLTKNEALVFDALAGSDQPMSAYALLDRLRDHGLRAPVQIYRALDRLVEFGLAHRLESLNAFVACSHPGCEETGQAVFAICDDCGKVAEFSVPDLNERLSDCATESHFIPSRATVEMHGTCQGCAEKPEAPDTPSPDTPSPDTASQ